LAERQSLLARRPGVARPTTLDLNAAEAAGPGGGGGGGGGGGIAGATDGAAAGAGRAGEGGSDGSGGGGGGGAGKAREGEGGEAQGGEDWECPHCTFVNSRRLGAPEGSLSTVSLLHRSPGPPWSVSPLHSPSPPTALSVFSLASATCAATFLSCSEGSRRAASTAFLLPDVPSWASDKLLY
jgi:hypothetical protein